MQVLRNITEKLSQFLNTIALILLTLTAAITVINVISRAAFHAPIFGVTELVQYGILAAVALAAPFSTLNHCHPTVDILVDALPVKVRNGFRIFTNVMTMCFFGLFAIKMWPFLAEMFNSHRTTESLFIPYWIINAFIELCMISVFIVELILCLEHIYLLIKGKNDFEDLMEGVEKEAEK